MHHNSCTVFILLACLLVAVQAVQLSESEHIPALVPRDDELLFTVTLPPYSFDPLGEEQKVTHFAPRPDGDILITGYVQEVYQQLQDGSLLPLTFDRDVDNVYFHHSVHHRSDPAHRKQWNSPYIHNAPFMFPQNPEVIGTPLHFPPGAGFRANESTPAEAVCVHVVNSRYEPVRLFVRYTMTYRAYAEGDAEVVTERFPPFLMHSLMDFKRYLASHPSFPAFSTASARSFGHIERGHGNATTYASHWHIHHGVHYMELWVARGVPSSARIGSVADVLEHAETIELMHRVEEGLLVSQIQVQPIEYDEWRLGPRDYIIMNAELDWDIAMQSLHDGDPMMGFAFLWLSYEDQWQGHRSDSSVYGQNIFGHSWEVNPVEEGGGALL